MADSKFVNEANLRRYTKKVQAADEESAKTVKSTATDSSTTGEYPVLLNSKVYNAQGGAGTTDEVKLDTGLRFNPATSTLTVSDGTNSATFSPTGGSAGDFTGTTTVSIVAGTSSAAPKVSVKVGSSNTATSGELTKASNSAYGVVKVDNAMSSTSTNPVQNNVADAAINAAAKTVNQTTASGSTPINAVISNVSGIGEVKTTSDIQYTPSTRRTTIHANGKTSGTSTSFVFGDGTLQIGNATIDAESYSGRATGSETQLKNELISKTQFNDGASLIGYFDDSAATGEESKTVAEALTDIYEKIGGVTALETNKADKTAAVGSITGTSGGNETGNYTMVSGTGGTFAYNNNKVTQTADTSTTTGLPVLLANSSSGGTATTKYRGNITVKPSDGTLSISNPSSGVATSVVISSDTITFESGAQGSPPVTLPGTQYGGNAATATSATSATSATTATNLANAPAITITAGTSSDAPKVNVTAGGKSGTAQELTKGDATHYGCVKVDASPTSGSSNAVSSGGVLTAITNAISSYKNSSWAIVTTLPTADGTHQGIIYLIKDSSASSPNVYDEYIEIDETPTGSTRTWKFEKIGTTDAGVDVVSLTDSEIDAIWANPDAA